MYTKREINLVKQEFDKCIYCGYLTIRSIKLLLPRDIVSSFLNASFEIYKVLILVLVLAVVTFGIGWGDMSHSVDKEILGIVN
jgi:hypothetical protein